MKNGHHDGRISVVFDGGGRGTKESVLVQSHSFDGRLLEEVDGVTPINTMKGHVLHVSVEI